MGDGNPKVKNIVKFILNIIPNVPGPARDAVVMCDSREVDPSIATRTGVQ